MSDDRKYRQRGYQDDDRRERTPQAPRPPKAPYDPRIPRDPKTPNMMAFHEVFRCARCGAIEGAPIGSLSTCAKCGVDLRSCIQCVSFDPSARFECLQPLKARVSPKDGRNECPSFAPRLRVERETGSTPATESSAKSAFDSLFKN
jgi:hypothetical protein